MQKKRSIMMPRVLKGLCAALAAWALLFAAAGCVPGKSGGQGAESLFIASWNVQALFDGTDGGNEYGDYRADAGWTEEKYRARLNAITAAIQGMAAESDGAENGGGKAKTGGAPDVMALIEIENAGVLGEIAAMPGMDYGWTFFAAAPGASLGIGVMSRLPIIGAKTHSVHFGEKRGPRPALEIRLDAGGEMLAFFLCHWKSKLGGEEKTEATRRSEAAVIARRLAELGVAEPETFFILMGDLNENYDEFTRVDMAYSCALVPDTPEAAEGVTALRNTARIFGIRPGFRDFLALCGTRPPRTTFLTAPDGAALYSPWMDETLWADETEGFPRGSYYYKERWETIDHVLLNGAAFDGSGWDFAEFRAAGKPPFTNSGGAPAAYVPRTGSGLSDHLPVLVRLERKPLRAN